jgi:hypothetical protein
MTTSHFVARSPASPNGGKHNTAYSKIRLYSNASEEVVAGVSNVSRGMVSTGKSQAQLMDMTASRFVARPPACPNKGLDIMYYIRRR